MKSHKNEQLEMLIKQFAPDDVQVDQMLAEIEQGDELLDQHLPIECPEGALDRVESAIDRHTRRLFWFRTSKIAAMVAIVFGLLVGIVNMEQGDKVANKDISRFLETGQVEVVDYLTNEEVLSNLADSQEEIEQKVDDLELEEFRKFLDEPETDSDDPIDQSFIGPRVEITS